MDDPVVGQGLQAETAQAQAQQEGEERGQGQVAQGAGGADGDFPPAVIAIVQGVDRHRLGPAEQNPGVAKQQSPGSRMVPTGSMWGIGVQGEAAHDLGGGVAVAQGHVAVGHLVDDDGKEEDHGHEADFQDIGDV